MGVTIPWLWPATPIVSAHWSLREVTAPATEPVTLAQAKIHLKIEATETYFDADVTAQIVAARQQVEKETSRYVARGTYDLAFDAAANGGVWAFPYSTISSITSVTVYDTDWATTVLDAASYFLDADSVPPRLILDTAADDPALEVELRDQRATVIRFIGGPDETAPLSGVAKPSPAWAVQAIYLLLELWRTPKPDPVVQAAYDRLINLHRSVEVA